MIPQNRFLNITDTVIEKLEGGYYHPDMMVDGRLNYNPLLASSGETMFGIDRKNGASLKTNPGWGDFWLLIDRAGARKSWHWNYRGGAYENQLRSLAGKIMFPHFTRLFNKYLSPKAQEIVAGDARVLLHFAYASWNGEGWFDRFAGKFNSAVLTISDKNKLAAAVLNNRTTSTSKLIRQSGEKMVAIFAAMTNTGGPIAAIAAIIALFF